MNDTMTKQVETYVTPIGKAVFEEWLRDLGDVQARARIKVRLDRLRMGNPGDCRAIGGSVHELRVDYGPGYRVYFAYFDASHVLVLCGGDKSTQTQDIARAQAYWEDYQKRMKEEGDGETK